MKKELTLFRKSTFGGFNRKDVIGYIEKLRNESFEYRRQVEDTVKALNEKIIELENAAKLVDDKGASEGLTVSVNNKVNFNNNYCGDISNATKHLKTVADELCRSLGDFIDKLSSRGIIDEDICSCEEKIITETVASEKTVQLSGIDDILSSFDFICSEKAEEISDSEENEEGSVVSDILSGLSFLG